MADSMGRKTWQWLAISLVLFAAPAFFVTNALGEETTEDCPSGNCPYVEPDSKVAKEEAAAKAKDDDPPPLELGVGTTADKESTDPLANGGVTVVKDATAKPVGTKVEEPAVKTDPLSPVTPPMWTPNSDRFLLKDRQDTLSLKTEVDSTDTGDFSHFPDPPKQTPKPVRRNTTVSKPQALPAPRQDTIQPGNPVENPVNVDTAEITDTDAGHVKELSTTLEDDGEGAPVKVLSDHFDADDEMASGSDSFVLGDDTSRNVPVIGAPATDEGNTTAAGVINPRGLNENPPPGSPSLADVLNGRTEDENLGSSFEGVSIGRSLGIMLAMVAGLFLLFWVAKYFKGGFRPGQQLPLSVMETINLGSGRQITIMEMGESALILGVTPQSINLLDKVPLGLINSSYQGTVNAIIDKESKALPDDWARQPQFAVPENTRQSQLVPPLASAGTYGPSGQRVSVSELRRARSGGATATIDMPTRPGPGGDDQAKTELIGRLRDQLNRLER